MTLPIVLIVLASSLLHASWNLLARRQRSEISFFGRLLLIVLAAGFVPGVVSEWHARSIPLVSWLCMLGSASCLAVYMYGLGKAYSSSDFTIVYPVVRGLPVLMTGIFDVFRRHFPSLFGWLGMVLVVTGCALAPLHSFKGIKRHRFFNRAISWMLVAALSSVGYNAFDKIAQEHVTSGYGGALRYAYFLYALWCGAYWILINLIPPPGKEGTGSPGWKYPALAAVCNFFSYSLVLWAFQLVDQASYVVAFRQAGVLFGVITAFVFFKERGLATRLTGAILLTTGLVLIALLG